MSIALWCVVVAGLLPVVTVGIAKARGPHYDNADPRRWLEQQEGLARRADQAHRNHFEAFPLFAVAVLAALFRGVSVERLDSLALLFIVCRLLYTAAYLADLNKLRSAVWTVGFICATAILVLAAVGPAR
jgi:uncharacterized MAPEG superfamily protein